MKRGQGAFIKARAFIRIIFETLTFYKVVKDHSERAKTHIKIYEGFQMKAIF